jgi:WD40 repeat protein
MYLVFGLPEISGNQSVIGLSFLKADTGEVCPVSDAQWETGIDDGLREHFAWLPDGRLLYVPSSGDMTILVPCEPDSANSTISYPVNFTHALDYHEHSGRVLLKNQTSFWILDGNTLEVIQVPNVTPNPYELHWDRFAWSPDGNRLAISRLNGQTAEDGSTLFVMDAGTGTVESELPLDIASDQSAPGVEWTSDDELLLHGSSALFLIDFRTDPPKFTDVLRDIFLLDISYPDDISTFAWEGHHLSVRVNHPHNQGIYIYHPESGQVEIIQPKDASPLLFFPNGEMVEMANYIGDPPAEDIYELMWVDAPDIASQIITVQGHLPRNYPNLFPRYLPQLSQIAFGSSQGVSVVSIPDGETLGFWELGGGGGYSSYVVPPSAYPALVVVADGDGLYYIPLP